MGMIRVIKPF